MSYLILVQIPTPERDPTVTPGGDAAQATPGGDAGEGETGETDITQGGITAPIVCESSLILLIGLAQRDYGYQPSIDPNQLEQGQYGDYFQNNMEEDMSESGDVAATDEAEGADMQMTPEATAETDMAEAGITLLEPPIVVNEDLRCTALRQDVEEFFATMRQNMNTMQGQGAGNQGG